MQDISFLIENLLIVGIDIAVFFGAIIFAMLIQLIVYQLTGFSIYNWIDRKIYKFNKYLDKIFE